MTRPVSVVIPALDDLDLFEANLPPLLEELERRALGDEVIVVDDTGQALLEGPLGAHFGGLRVLSATANVGFARALTAGVDAARHDLVYSMNPDVRVRSGFLDPLVACFDEDDVFAVVPRVLLFGDEQRIESVTELRERGGSAEVRQPALGEHRDSYLARTRAVAFAVGGAALFDRQALLERGFDPLFLPFYWEDVDLCWCAWRSGLRVLYQPASVVEHHHRGTIGKVVPPVLVRAAQEKNRLLFQWKHLDSPERIRRHVSALYRRALDAWLTDEREELVWLALALEQAGEALAAQGELGDLPLSFEQALEKSSES